MHFSIQPILEDENFKLIPLQQSDFERLYAVGSDPEIWKQHPNPERYKREVFEILFKGAMESKGAFLVLNKTNDEVLGTTRFYDYDEESNSILIGYTFYSRKYWGQNVNPSVKKMMLDYIFQFVDKVIFHVGKENLRSRKAMERLGAQFINEEHIAYFGEPSRINAIYEIRKKDWVRDALVSNNY